MLRACEVVTIRRRLIDDNKIILFSNYVLSIYVKRDDFIIFNILCNEMKKFFYVT